MNSCEHCKRELQKFMTNNVFWTKSTNTTTTKQTRGPKGPWVAHLRKRSKVTVEPFTKDH